MALTCPYCGHPNFATAKVCRRCRKDLSNLCSECGQPRTPGSSFCTHCGSILDIKIDTDIYKKPLVKSGQPEKKKKDEPVVLPVNRVNRTLKKCPECFHKIDDAALFCIYCGYVFDPVPIAPQPVVAEPPPVEREKPVPKAVPKPAAVPPAKPTAPQAAAKPGPKSPAAESPGVPPKPRATAPRPTSTAQPVESAPPEPSPVPPRPVRTPPPAAAAPNVDDTPTPPPRPRPAAVKSVPEEVEREPEPSKSTPEPAPDIPAPRTRAPDAEKEKPQVLEGARVGGPIPLDDEVPEFDPKKNAFLDVEIDEVDLEGVPGLVPLPAAPEYTSLDAIEFGAGRTEVASVETIPVAGGLFPVNANGRATLLRPFRIDRFPVTNDMYRRFVAATRIEPPPDWIEGRHIHGAGRYPVAMVTFAQAQAFARWAGKRLPTALEWEKAACGDSPRRYPWGDEPDAARGHFDGERGCLDHVDAHPNGASPVGCEDLMGNACEWTVDPDRAEPLLKGGCYLDDVTLVTIVTRLRTSPDEKSPLIGFRCVQDLENT